MRADQPKTIRYKRSQFATRLPIDYLYTPSHFWLANQGDHLWRVGFTKFSVRMLGELVDHGLEVGPSTEVAVGQIIGWVEGFKAISDLYCAVHGRFKGGNPDLRENIETVHKDPYRHGWLYEAEGTPDERCVDVHGYVAILDKTIDRMLEQQKGEEIE